MKGPPDGPGAERRTQVRPGQDMTSVTRGSDWAGNEGRKARWAWNAAPEAKRAADACKAALPMLEADLRYLIDTGQRWTARGDAKAAAVDATRARLAAAEARLRIYGGGSW